MKRQDSIETETLGHYAHQAISKHLKRSIRQEAAVLKDEDPEALHQMRVEMRRLRTALEVFSPSLELPKPASIKRIRKIAKDLGCVRDLDVMQVELETLNSPDLPETEQAKLDKILVNLQQQRRRDFGHLEKTLTGLRYRKFKRTLQDWLDQSSYKEIAGLPILTVLPDLLLPLMSQLLLHPGWLVGTVAHSSKITIPQKISSQVLSQLEQQGKVLHNLRKQTKRLRYQTEFFIDFYNPTYAAQSEDFQTVQKVLGQVQDSLVLSEFLRTQLAADLVQELPSLAQQLQKSRAKAWQTWQAIQQRYLDPQFRQILRTQLMIPQLPVQKT